MALLDFLIDSIRVSLLLGLELKNAGMALAVLPREQGLFAQELEFLLPQTYEEGRG